MNNGLQETQDGCLALLSFLVNPAFQFLRVFIHYSALNKTISVLRGLRSPPSGPFERLKLDFIQLPLSMNYQYALFLFLYVVFIVYMFFRWVKIFPCHKADALTVAKKLLESVFPTWNQHNLQRWRHPLHWTNHTNVNENLANFLELTLSLSLAIIRQSPEN